MMGALKGKFIFFGMWPPYNPNTNTTLIPIILHGPWMYSVINSSSYPNKFTALPFWPYLYLFEMYIMYCIQYMYSKTPFSYFEVF